MNRRILKAGSGWLRKSGRVGQKTKFGPSESRSDLIYLETRVGWSGPGSSFGRQRFCPVHHRVIVISSLS